MIMTRGELGDLVKVGINIIASITILDVFSTFYGIMFIEITTNLKTTDNNSID